MASFLPFLTELLPMVMPASTHIVRAKDIQPSHPTVEGPVVQRLALANLCGMCISVLMVRPMQRTNVRHNSEQDAIVYLISGSAEVLVKEGLDDDLQKHTLAAGDFIFIPAWMEHQIVANLDQDASCLIVQQGASPVGADLTDWGGAEKSTRA